MEGLGEFVCARGIGCLVGNKSFSSNTCAHRVGKMSVDDQLFNDACAVKEALIEGCVCIGGVDSDCVSAWLLETASVSGGRS